MISALTHRDDFLLLQRSGSTRRSGPLRARVIFAEDGAPAATLKLGFTIGRKFGGAVQRNRMRRRLRHCVAEASRTVPVATSHLLLSASPNALDTSHPELLDHCRRLIGSEPVR